MFDSDDALDLLDLLDDSESVNKACTSNDNFNLYWAGSVSQSIYNDTIAGKNKIVIAG